MNTVFKTDPDIVSQLVARKQSVRADSASLSPKDESPRPEPGLSLSADRRAMHHHQCSVHFFIICLSLLHHTFNHVCMYLSSRDYPSYWCKHLEKQQTKLVRYEKYEGSLEGKLYE